MAIIQRQTGRHVLRLTVAAALCAVGSVAQAQITRGFIAPHEYALPGMDYKPFNVFVEYVTLQDTDRFWDGDGDKVSGNNVEVLVGLSKYVRFFKIESLPNLGVGWEIIVPKVGIRDKTAGTSTGGIADPITGPAIWIKPTENWTLGADLFLQVPVGDKDVGGGDRWNVIGSVFWDGQFSKINYTGNLGYTIAGKPTAGPRLGNVYYTNHRLGYRVSELIEPFIGLDYERQQGSDANPSNHETGAAVGVMFHTVKNSNISVHYQRGLEGEARAVSDNLNVRFVVVW